MTTVHPQYITDAKGKKLSVVLPIDEYNTLLQELEELEDIKLYDEAKATAGETVPVEEAFKLIEAKRNS